MKPIRVPELAPEQLAELEKLYRTTRNVRLRTRAQMVLLAAERHLTAAQIAEIVRASEETVRSRRSPGTRGRGTCASCAASSTPATTWPRGSRDFAMNRNRERRAG